VTVVNVVNIVNVECSYALAGSHRLEIERLHVEPRASLRFERVAREAQEPPALPLPPEEATLRIAPIDGASVTHSALSAAGPGTQEAPAIMGQGPGP
jgi:hypothetical protein